MVYEVPLLWKLSYVISIVTMTGIIAGAVYGWLKKRRLSRDPDIAG